MLNNYILREAATFKTYNLQGWKVILRKVVLLIDKLECMEYLNNVNMIYSYNINPSLSHLCPNNLIFLIIKTKTTNFDVK